MIVLKSKTLGKIPINVNVNFSFSQFQFIALKKKLKSLWPSHILSYDEVKYVYIYTYR